MLTICYFFSNNLFIFNKKNVKLNFMLKFNAKKPENVSKDQYNTLKYTAKSVKQNIFQISQKFFFLASMKRKKNQYNYI